MSVLSTNQLTTPELASQWTLASVSIEEVNELGDLFGHISPQELIGNFVLRAECKTMIADLQIAALQALQTGSYRDGVETAAWQECRARAMLQEPAESGLYI